jgi:hypothetical protein
MIIRYIFMTPELNYESLATGTGPGQSAHPYSLTRLSAG